MQTLKLALFLLSYSALPCWALDGLADSEMSDAVAQDGLTVMWQLADKGIRMDAIALVDKNGTPSFSEAGKLLVR